jgi:hypothetical protein
MKSPEFIDTDLDSLDSFSEKGASNNDARGNSNGAANPNGRAELDARVEQARQQMLDLRRQQDELEKERLELEDLRRREEEFEHGKAEVLDELLRTIASIEHEEFDLHKRAALLTNCREIFQDYNRQLNDIRESDWTSEDLKVQLNKAFMVLESSRAELNKGRAQLNYSGEGPIRQSADLENNSSFTKSPGDGSFDFVLEVKRGIARNLPLIILGILALLILYSRK